MDLLSEILSNPLLNGLGFILGVISIVLAFVFYKKSIRAKEPCWSIRNINLVRGFGSTIQDLEIFYKKQEVENLSVSKIIFWNNGSETLNFSDISQTNILKIIPAKESVKLLDTKILSANSETSQFASEINNNEALLRFDYLDQGQGALIQVFHTGTSSQDLILKGAIKGVSKLKRIAIRQPLLPLPLPRIIEEKVLKSLKPRNRYRFAIFIWLIIGVFAITIGIYSLFFSPTPVEPKDKFPIILFSSIYAVLGFLVAYMHGKSLTPEGLDGLLDDDRFFR